MQVHVARILHPCMRDSCTNKLRGAIFENYFGLSNHGVTNQVSDGKFTHKQPRQVAPIRDHKMQQNKSF